MVPTESYFALDFWINWGPIVLREYNTSLILLMWSVLL